MKRPNIDLPARARDEMVANQFLTDFGPEVAEQLQSISAQDLLRPDREIKDLRELLWSSIDNVESRDLDQLEYAEPVGEGQWRIMVAIADVDAYVPKSSAIDKHAERNTTSVYTDIVTFPMLPDQLSFDLTSLLPEQDRLALVVDMLMQSSGEIVKSDVYRALVRNKAKLNYKAIGAWLERGNLAPESITSVPGLEAQLLLQDDLKERIKDLRQQHGALHLQTNEASTVIQDGQIIDLELVQDNPARDLIENFMIAANVAVSQFLEAKGLSSIRRVVKTREKWERIVELARELGYELSAEPDVKSLAKFLLMRKQADPDHFPDLSLSVVKLLGRGEYTVETPGQEDVGHFALAVHDYTHATAPNRRFTDLVTQRLLKAAIAGKPTPYTVAELQAVATQCTERETASNKVERTMRKVAAAVLLSNRIGEVFDAFVTGVKPDATYVRLIRPPAEGRVVKGEKGLRVGQKIKVRLLSTDPVQAFIDFARR